MMEPQFYTPKKRRKCPKCRCVEIIWHEVWGGHTIQFQQDKDGVINRVGMMDNESDPFKVVGECNKCGHLWAVPKAKQITDITEETALGLEVTP